MGCGGSKDQVAKPDAAASTAAGGGGAAAATTQAQPAAKTEEKVVPTEPNPSNAADNGKQESPAKQDGPRNSHSNKPAVLEAVTGRDVSAVAGSRIIRNQTVYERYDVDRGVLGNGLSGAVRCITNKNTKRKCALKSLLTENMSQKKWDMLYNEVEIYLKLDHPNICKLLEVYEDEAAVHLVMELCSGKELYDRLASKKRYSEKDTVIACMQMLDALHYMHWHKMCHRDLKLENWVYADDSEDSKLKLIDFGFSKIFSPGQPMTAMHGTVYYVAPEVLDGHYDEKCDIWSTGVIIYMLLSGSPPFNGANDNGIIKKIKNGKFAFEGPRWAGISDQAKDFISVLLQKDPSKRPTAKEAMDHQWLKDMKIPEAAAPEIAIDVLQNMKAFASANVIKRAACGLMAFSMTTDDMDELEAQFRKMDKAGNGTILLNELTEVLKTHLNMTEKEALSLFDKMDQTGDHEIHYSEFLAASLQSRFLLQENVIREAFQKFDIDNTGFITVDNLRQVLGDEYNGTQVEDIIAAVDYKKNGVIEYDEFVQALMDLGQGGKDTGDGDGKGNPNHDIVRKLSKQLVDNAPAPRQFEVPKMNDDD